MHIPIVAIVGRPNVGKSRLFNRLVGGSEALVDDQPGVTRDRHYGHADWRGKNFWVVDTGGLIPGAENPLDQKVWEQAFVAIQEADILICVFDGQTGVTPVDRQLVQELRKQKKPVLYAVNKIDVAPHENRPYEFSELGIDPLLSVSAEHGRGISDLLEAVFPLLAETIPEESPDEKDVIKVAIIGRPNVGKSTLINRLIGQERVVVNELAGTTRDSIDVECLHAGRRYRFVDTAGVKKKDVTHSRLEKFSAMKTIKAVERSYVVCLLLDAFEGLTRQDMHLAQFAWESGKGLILLANKWDLVSVEWKEYRERLEQGLGSMAIVPKLNIAAKEGLHCDKLFGTIRRLYQKMERQITTGRLNRWLEDVQSKQAVPLFRGRHVKLFYGTQVGTKPPRFAFFTNHPKGIPTSYQRFLMGELRGLLSAEDIPIRLEMRQKE